LATRATTANILTVPPTVSNGTTTQVGNAAPNKVPNKSTKKNKDNGEKYLNPTSREKKHRGLMQRAKGVEEMSEGTVGQLEEFCLSATQTIKTGPMYSTMIQHLTNVAKKIWLADRIDIMIKNIQNFSVKEGTLLIQKGDLMHHMIIVLNDSGLLVSPTKCYEPGVPFGETSLTRVTTAKHALLAMGNCEVLVIDGRAFRRDLQHATVSEKDTVRNILKMSDQFSQLHFTVQDELGLYLQPVKYNSGESLMVQDEVGEEMLFITSGVANVSINMGQGNAAKVVAQVATGKVVGEGALFDTNSKRSATVTATTEVRCFRLLYTDFHRIAPDALETLRLLYLRTILLKPAKNASDSSNKFNNMPVQLLNDLCRCATMKHYAKGEYIITEGDPVTNDSCLYIIRRGTVAFEKTFDAKEGKCPPCSRYQYDLHSPHFFCFLFLFVFCLFFVWFVGSLVRWFVGSLVRWFVGSLVLCFFLLRYTQVPKNWAKCLVVPSLGKVHC